ncbi:DUF1642 domain-containing protein [Streptococcus suis]|nr:DUF1642 domain-containing protein [Streptococcus suis]
MTKQEAIEAIKNIDTLNINDRIAGQQVDMVIKNQVLDIISQIHELQNVVVPKFVAEWYEKNNDDLNTAIYSTITKTYRKINGENDDLLDTFEGWLVYQENSILMLVQMQLFGYQVEQEKLYTVEIPDPNGWYKVRCLTRRSNGKLCIDGFDYKDILLETRAHFTESEIKQDFEWAWEFREEVD